jgi:hypothetical protein
MKMDNKEIVFLVKNRRILFGAEYAAKRFNKRGLPGSYPPPRIKRLLPRAYWQRLRPLILQNHIHMSKEKELHYDYEQSCFVLGR